MRNLFRLVGFLFRSSERLSVSRFTVIVLVASGVIAGLASTGLLAVINEALSRTFEESKRLTWSFVGLCILLPVARFVSQVLLVRMAQSITYDLRIRLSRKILSAPLRQLEELGPSRLLATLTDDIGSITGALANVPVLFLHLTVVMSCLGYMGWLSWRLLLLVFGAVAIGVVSYQLPLLRALRHFRLSREGWDRLFDNFRGLTEGTKELKVHRGRRRAFINQELDPAADALRKHNVTGGMIYAVANSWGQVLFFVVIGLILFVIPGFSLVPAAVMSGYTLAILYMLTPLDVILNQLPNLGRAVVAVDAVENLGLTLERDTRDPEEIEHVEPPPWNELSLAGVTHQYYREDKEDMFTLGPIDLVLRPGELVFVVGGNGSGKTTLAKLLIGLYSPASGTLSVDGEPIHEDTLESYRQLFSVVFSDFFLFESLLGLEEPQLDDKARRYLRELQLEQKVQIEDGRFSTTELSQGQRKRLALLTAYLEDRPICLFDEWAADQDPGFKRVFYLELLPELKRRGKGVIVISHDDQYYEVADRIVKLDFGTIEYDGSSAEFLESWSARHLSSETHNVAS